MDNIEKQIEKLRLVKRNFDLEYWRKNDTTHSDEIYDQIKDKLDRLLNEHPQYQIPEDTKLESVYMNTFAEVIHKHKMLSLGKTLSIPDFITWFQSIRSKVNLYYNTQWLLVFEFKADGFAISLEYEDGVLMKASTRGDGNKGDDITPTVSLISDIPKKLDNNFTGEIGGEIYMKKSSLVKLNEKLKSENKRELKNVRNAAAGIARQQDTSTRMAEYLSFLCYRYIDDNNICKGYSEEMDNAKALGFNTLYHDLYSVTADARALTNDIITDVLEKFKEKRDSLDMDVDGVVIKVDDRSIQSKLGDKEKVPNWAVAYKFPAIEKLTTLLDVEWEYGVKDGRLTPMAVIEPVDIGGTTVKRPTLHNIDEIKRLGAKINATLRVSRRGDVIPKVEEVITELMPDDAREIEIPKVCPICEQPTIIDGAFVKCNNRDCSGRTAGRIKIFVGAMEIDDLGVTTIDKLVEADKLQSIIDLFKLSISDIADLDKLGEKSARKILKNIDGCKQQPLWRVLSGLSIKMVGGTTAKLLEKNIGSLTAFKTITKNELMNMNDMGNVTSDNIINWLAIESNQQLLDELISLGIGNVVETIDIKEDKLKGLKIGFTGSLNHFSRTECSKIIEQYGGIPWGIKKEINLLLVGDGAKPAKIEKAEKLGAKVITEEEFMNMIK